VYDISTSSVAGRHVVEAQPQECIVAEGLFAGRLVGPLKAEGLLADALCVRQNRWVTALRRLARDLAEHRKPPHILVRRGWALLRDEPRVVAEAVAQGARCLTPSEAEQQLAEAHERRPGRGR
jgi:uridine kinase